MSKSTRTKIQDLIQMRARNATDPAGRVVQVLEDILVGEMVLEVSLYYGSQYNKD